MVGKKMKNPLNPELLKLENKSLKAKNAELARSLASTKIELAKLIKHTGEQQAHIIKTEAELLSLKECLKRIIFYSASMSMPLTKIAEECANNIADCSLRCSTPPATIPHMNDIPYLSPILKPSSKCAKHVQKITDIYTKAWSDARTGGDTLLNAVEVYEDNDEENDHSGQTRAEEDNVAHRSPLLKYQPKISLERCAKLLHKDHKLNSTLKADLDNEDKENMPEEHLLHGRNIAKRLNFSNNSLNSTLIDEDIEPLLVVDCEIGETSSNPENCEKQDKPSTENGSNDNFLHRFTSDANKTQFKGLIQELDSADNTLIDIASDDMDISNPKVRGSQSKEIQDSSSLPTTVGVSTAGSGGNTNSLNISVPPRNRRKQAKTAINQLAQVHSSVFIQESVFNLDPDIIPESPLPPFSIPFNLSSSMYKPSKPIECRTSIGQTEEISDDSSDVSLRDCFVVLEPLPLNAINKCCQRKLETVEGEDGSPEKRVLRSRSISRASQKENTLYTKSRRTSFKAKPKV